ncbi:hypothetical protein M9H77_21981 [Catharanthus roseus]|uniref:Uncharacterized protein n=1 Tax=Catharanthus roseus TaxID=4058 RepID=A0ACC0ARU2_CATRO|nr:hypothetical protein M9H77_21981 [Catharanthus roseus]
MAKEKERTDLLEEIMIFFFQTIAENCCWNSASAFSAAGILLQIFLLLRSPSAASNCFSNFLVAAFGYSPSQRSCCWYFLFVPHRSLSVFFLFYFFSLCSCPFLPLLLSF